MILFCVITCGKLKADHIPFFCNGEIRDNLCLSEITYINQRYMSYNIKIAFANASLRYRFSVFAGAYI